MKKLLFIALALFIQNVFAIENIVQTYSENNKFGLIVNNEKITDPKYFCSTLADVLGAKRIKIKITKDK